MGGAFILFISILLLGYALVICLWFVLVLALHSTHNTCELSGRAMHCYVSQQGQSSQSQSSRCLEFCLI